ncbi:MAG: hypothetical protein EA373_13830 [Oceanospirillales bacterium]|nr:MAG: hypothetical protein EA373_13830 [Oceanospirillales bacterium]
MYQAHTAVESIVRQPEQFLPLLADASQQSRWVTLIDPPERLDQNELKNAGIDLKKLRIVHTRNRHQWLKTLSTCVCNGLNSLVVAWPEPSVSHATVKALGEACQHGKSFCLLLGNRQPVQVALRSTQPEEQLQLAL